MIKNRVYWLVIIWLALIGCSELTAAENPPGPTSPGTLQVAGGDHIAGSLLDCDQPGLLRWQGAAFESPFDFDLAGVGVVYFPPRAEGTKAKGEYCFELQGGDVLFGSLVGLTAEEVRLDVPPFGLLHVERENVRCILRWHDGADLIHWHNGADLVYVGLNGLTEWEREHPHGAWRQEDGVLATDRAGALLARNFDLPPQATVEFALSWTAKPDFVFALGAGRHGYEQAFRLEVWDDELVLLRETDKDADLALLGKVTTGEGRCHLLVYLDQQQNRATVFSPEGTLLGELAVSESAASPQPCIRLVNHGGNVRLEQLRIMRWDGTTPREIQGDKSRIHRSDGSVVYGEIQGFDPATGEFLIGEGDRPERIHADDMGSAVMSRSDVTPPTGVRAILQDGTRISGEYRRLKDGRLWLSCPAVAEPLAVPVSELKSLVVLDCRKPPSNTDSRVGRLVMENVSLRGYLVEDGRRRGAGCLVWQPLGSATSATLAAGAAARIVYRALPPKPPRPQTPPAAPVRRPVRPLQPVQAGGVLGVLARALTGDPSNPAVLHGAGPSGPCLYLRTGDAIPCEVERIDERGVTFRSPTFDAAFASHDKIKAVELENRSLATKIDKPSRDRLLMLPRMQKDNPPTHLIRSTRGDYLRARLIELDDETVTVETRLETRKLPRRHVTRIIWLDEETPDRPVAAETGGNASTTTRVQALCDDGIRLTFFAEKLTGTFLEGTSEVLGPCRVELAEVDQLAIGGAIEQVAANLPYQRWKLEDAPEPRFVQDDGAAGSSIPGTESALVGKPAPDFELETLDGPQFRLSDHRGKVVVLEFWATWCGPCVNTLPQIDLAVKELEDQGVILVAVNLEETPEAITTVLERLELETTVALDRDGIVARQYAAVAIPQTVIVDSAGNVARLFVGGGRQFDQQLRETLQSVLPAIEGQEESH